MPNFQFRRGHCAAAFSLCPGMTEVVLFGGSISFPAKTNSFIANTNVLRFGEFNICLNFLISMLILIVVTGHKF